MSWLSVAVALKLCWVPKVTGMNPSGGVGEPVRFHFARILLAEVGDGDDLDREHGQHAGHAVQDQAAEQGESEDVEPAEPVPFGRRRRIRFPKFRGRRPRRPHCDRIGRERSRPG